MKNNKQIYKNLHSKKRLSKPIKIVYDKDLNYVLDLIKNKYNDIIVLGRNNDDIKEYKNTDHIKFMTVHASKGLEADCIIILNLIDDILGFPNKIPDNKVINYLNKHKVDYPFDEERRLFYVALTRTKNNIYLLVDRQNPSIFVKELLYNSKKYIEVINL
jgi:DNA helicase-4